MPSIDEIYEGLKLAVERRRFRQIDFFKPYKKQAEFFEMGAYKRERLYMAGNQLYGKTTAGAVETTCHLTGRYPDWWKGRRWDRPVTAWAVGESGALVRDVQQSKLCGEWSKAHGPDAEDWGTGYIPREYLLDRTLGRGVQYGFDSITVRHITGGISTLGFKAYEQGRAKVQGKPLDFVWPDEEPPLDIYGELLARIAMTGGMVMVTFTPLNGMMRVVPRFINDDSAEAKRDRGVVKAGLRDVEGKTKEEVDSIIAGYEPHEREARINGEPLLGEGAVWEGINQDMIKMPFMPLSEIPLEWRKLWGTDFGIGHPFAAVLATHDADTDIIRIVHEIRVKDALPAHHVMMMRATAAEPPMAWPKDGGDREQSSGEQLVTYYKTKGNQPGMNVRATHAQFPHGGYNTEAGVAEILTRMRDGRFFVSEHCTRWFEEFTGYHRKNGLIVKLNDDLMSATRIAVMDIRHAKACPLGGKVGVYQSQRRTKAAEWDIWTGQPIPS